MGGSNFIYLNNDQFEITNPNVYARSILFGKMYMELGDSCVIRSKDHPIECHLEFKQKVKLINKGFFSSGDKDGVTGKLINTETDKVYNKIKGKWSEKTTVTDAKGNEQILFDKPLYPPPKVIVKPEQEQEELESRRY